MSIDALIEEFDATYSRPKCKLCAESFWGELVDALHAKNAPAQTIERFIRSKGFGITDTTILRHARRECQFNGR